MAAGRTSSLRARVIMTREEFETEQAEKRYKDECIVKAKEEVEVVIIEKLEKMSDTEILEEV
jgi:hypothetical protein